MLSTTELLTEWIRLVEGEEPHASVRFGDASNIILAHETILTMDFVRSKYGWIKDPKYCGVTLPNAEARDKLLACLKDADYVGYLIQTDWVFRPLFDMVIHYYRIKLDKTFYAFENNYIARLKEFYEAFKDTKVLLCGSRAKDYKEVLERRYGWTCIVGTVDCPNWEYHETAIEEMTKIYEETPFRMAIVCAGAPGKMLTIHAKKLGAVGIDFGSGAEIAVQSDELDLYAWDYTDFPKY